MFAYEKDGKLGIMVAQNYPAAEGVTPDIVIEPTSDDPVKAKVTVNGVNVVEITPVPASTDVSTLTKLVDALKVAGVILAE